MFKLSHWSIFDWFKMITNESFILTAKNKKNKPLKKWPIETTAGFYANRVTDVSCIIDKKNLPTYEGGFSNSCSHWPANQQRLRNFRVESQTIIWKLKKALPTLYVEPTQNVTECIFESCDDNQSEADLEVDEDEGIYFFPGGEVSCPVADFLDHGLKSMKWIPRHIFKASHWLGASLW